MPVTEITEKESTIRPFLMRERGNVSPE